MRELNYLVFYKKEPSFQENNLLNSNAPWSEKKESILKNYVPLKAIKAVNLDAVYNYFQGEVWSPNGEARPLISALGLTHTSMSVGDLIFLVDYYSTLYEVARDGFNIVAEGVNDIAPVFLKKE